MSQTFDRKNMKLALIATLLAILSISSLFALPLISSAAGASITLSPTSATPGTSISVSGVGFQTSSGLTVYFNGAPVSSTTTTGSGTFSTSFKVPAGTAAGTYTVMAESCCTGGTVTASSSLTVTAGKTNTPKIVLRPFTVVAGKSVKVTGTHFTDSAPVTVKFNGATVSTTTVNSTGGFVTNFVVSTSTAAGSYTVTATDSSSLTASNTLTVTSASTRLALKITASAHRDGATATASGNNFLPSHLITVTFNGKVVGTATSNSSGGFSIIFVIADTPAGAASVVATDGTNTVTRSFTVNAYIVVSPTTVAPGAMLTVNGTGYAANSAITLTLGGTPISVTPTTNSNGSFQVSFTVPSTMASGAATMTAVDSAAHSASAHVRIS